MAGDPFGTTNPDEVCRNCGHGPREDKHRGIDGTGDRGLCLVMTEVPEGTDGAMFHRLAGLWVRRCACREWVE